LIDLCSHHLRMIVLFLHSHKDQQMLHQLEGMEMLPLQRLLI